MHGIEPPITHNIEFLLKQCSEITGNFTSINPLNLTDYGVEAMYPGDFPEPSISELKELLSVVDQIRDMVLSKTTGRQELLSLKFWPSSRKSFVTFVCVLAMADFFSMS